ncbi:ParB/RepB/Spo0J family partition protein [Flavobacterium sp. DG1-102-2]|uniref:ParB/RepB/Spo0J family partition protein n=1 Tax=Flavobacterium sp. DG1-102-2 TaxID=3081663 RepID=UPI00294A8813|nr:ParB/RepB/Spo0J family partition protein [Flavobacterium sp. DG1-102-2]MDV6169502.1 ParB/RepB/Spo0J family partition protein [Flavobacterium sp. DG1-102-2]
MSEDSNNLIDTFKSYPLTFLELPVDVVETDPNQPRKIFELRGGGDHSHLLKSIKRYGIEEPIKVSELTPERYIIMDGHRRFACAKELEFKTVPCRIYPKMNDGEFEARRYEMQNNRRSWRPIEKANAINRIKTEYQKASPKEIADLIGITQKNLYHFEDLRNTRMDYLELMSQYNLKEYQRIGFIRVLKNLRRIKQFQIDDIVKILFEKISDNLLYRQRDFSLLSGVFMTASLHEDYIEQFLSEPKMSVQHLSELTRLSGISTQIQSLIKELSGKKNVDMKLTEKEQTAFTELYKLMETFMY